MLEVLKIISYIVWIGVGIASIGSMFWALKIQNRMFKDIGIVEKNED